MKKNIHLYNIRKSVCTMANALKKTGLTLSEAFQKAWRRIKKGMMFRVVGVTFSNIQERLAFLKKFIKEDLSISLVREPENEYDQRAIKVIVHIKSIGKKTVIGYVPAGLAEGLSSVLDAEIKVKAELMGVIGGYEEKENLGALVSISV